ncbi:MAG: putative lipoprotein [Armatimonadetes bacterium]|jgi:basic membrane lipoprotein Med (substrate-binding protein (PBP1-ABC) superfamily)|nr:putative lipoprotein [Armatimonadota bacterium]
MLNRRTLLAAPLLLVVAGCGGNSSTSSGSETAGANTPAPAASGPPFKVALLTNGSLADSGWNSLAGKGLDQIKQELGAETSHQSSGEAQAEEALRGFARDGAKLVFAHGNEFGDAAKRVAEEFSDTTFVVSSGEVKGENLASLQFDIGEAAYLAGMASAALSRTGKAGQIGGMSIPPLKQSFALFEQGGKVINPKFTATTTYLGSWSDANAGKEKALAMIRAGADVLFQNADAAGEGVFQAAEEHKGVLVIGSNANQNELKPEIIPASAVLDVPKTFMDVARKVKDGTFKGDFYRNDLKSGNVYLAINPAFKDKIPADVLKKIEQAEADIKSGQLNLVGK